MRETIFKSRPFIGTVVSYKKRYFVCFEGIQTITKVVSLCEMTVNLVIYPKFSNKKTCTLHNNNNIVLKQ